MTVLACCPWHFVVPITIGVKATCLCSDGNLVASLLSHTLTIPQANIAHALEKVRLDSMYGDVCSCCGHVGTDGIGGCSPSMQAPT